jgi:hypothetical protein
MDSMLNASKKLCFRLAFAAAALSVAIAAQAQSMQPAPGGPLARLVRTPDESGSLPPDALADQTGAIQRYVEPVPGIDLEPFINQIVTVRHDTGETLLASQLDLPGQQLLPMIGESPRGTQSYRDNGVRQAQHIDSDDSTVELMQEGEELPQNSVMVPQGAAPMGAVYPDGGYPMYQEMQPGMQMPGMQMPGMQMPGMPMGAGPTYYDPMYSDPQAMYGPGLPNPGFVQPYTKPEVDRPHLYGDVEINFLRLHVNEEVFGKLSEDYEFSPRFVLGFTDIGGLNGRARYWLYGRETQTLNDSNIRAEFDVLDLEGTHHFAGKRSVVALAAGVRFARIQFEDEQEDESGADLLGLTMAADGFTPCFAFHGGKLGVVYGGRLSLLGGDWGGDNDFVEEQVRDDNFVVHELYAGIECSKCYRRLNLHARLAFEMQNWHSDVLSESDIGSISIVGPGVQVGAEF